MPAVAEVSELDPQQKNKSAWLLAPVPIRTGALTGSSSPSRNGKWSCRWELLRAHEQVHGSIRQSFLQCCKFKTGIGKAYGILTNYGNWKLSSLAVA